MRRSERGTAAVEMVLVAPALILLLAAIVGAGRVVTTKSAVLSAAREASRAASDAPDAETAKAIALKRINEIGGDLGLDPSRIEVHQSAGSFERGAPYAVEITYRVELGDLPGLGFIPGSFSVSARHVELTDRYRSR
jgi:hypothetical protein